MRLFYREGMAAMNCIYVMSGTCSVWRTAAFKQIPMRDHAVEDMLYTFEIHRRRLGKIGFARHAIVYTQEPQNLQDYTKQMLRWLRGYWSIVTEFGTPFGRQTLDAGQAIIMVQFILSTIRILVLPFAPIMGFWGNLVITSFLIDFGIITTLAIIAAIRDRNPRIVAFLWLYPVMFIYDQWLNVISFATHRKLTSGLWISPRRKEA
jgi:cellulose synthase/poly-beta-1,6-N-acetylglucosamine synthase-like glycosyltransferase